MGKVIVHGATNCGSSNFGDYIYVDKLCHYIRQKTDCNVYIADPSNFFLEHTQFRKGTLQGASLLVYAPGGYFGEGHAARFRDNLVQFIRFMPVGLRASALKIPIFVLGIGAGPNNSKMLSWAIRRITQNAICTTVRDRESYQALEKLGCPRVIESSDLILDMDIKKSAVETGQVRNIRRLAHGRKILLVHYNHDKKALDIFAQSVAAYVKKHPDWFVVVCYDQLLDQSDEMYDVFKKSVANSVLFSYSDPYELVSLLSVCTLILTSKLHVGVIGALFEKSVLCVAEHPEKSKRFYRQIGNKERCVSLFETSPLEILALLERYADRSVVIPNTEFEKARLSWSLFDKALASLSLAKNEEHNN